jgi:hypothetical protein
LDWTQVNSRAFCLEHHVCQGHYVSLVPFVDDFASIHSLIDREHYYRLVTNSLHLYANVCMSGKVTALIYSTDKVGML